MSHWGRITQEINPVLHSANERLADTYQCTIQVGDICGVGLCLQGRVGRVLSTMPVKGPKWLTEKELCGWKTLSGREKRKRVKR